jgi:hypothetical protein
VLFIIGATVFTELLGCYRKRIKDPYMLIGMIDGKLAGLVNGRLIYRMKSSEQTRT